MLEKFLNIFRIPDLRKRVLFTLAFWPSTGWARTFPRRA
jgi:hypothetical protein